MDISRGTNPSHFDAYRQANNDGLTKQTPPAKERSLPPSSIEQERLHQYTQETLAKHQNIQEAVQQLGLEYSMPFDQDHFQKLVYQKFPETLDAIPKSERHKGICLGLSMVWLKQRLEGKSDTDFHQSILNPEHDAALLQALSAQYVEQGAIPLEQPPSAISETIAPKLGLGLIAASKTNTSQTIPLEPLNRFAEGLENAAQQPRAQQGLLLLTDGHAMALMRDKDDKLHFFDPNYGVISSSADNRMCLYATMSNLMEDLPSDTGKLYVTEMQAAQKTEPHAPLHLMNLLA